MIQHFMQTLAEEMNDESRRAFRTMFITKTDVAYAIKLAEFVATLTELAEANGTTIAGLLGRLAFVSPYDEELMKHLAELETQL